MRSGSHLLEADAWQAAEAAIGRFGRVEVLDLARDQTRSVDRACRLILPDGRMAELRIDLKRIPTPGRSLHEQAVAHAALRHAGAPHDPTVTNTIAILVPVMPAGLSDSVRRLVVPLGPARFNVVIVSAAGGWWCWLPGIGIDAAEPDKQRLRKHGTLSGANSGAQVVANLPLTVVNQWLLKILLLHQAPASWWGGPRVAGVRGSDLATAAGVSTSMVYRLVEALAARGWMDVDLRIRRMDALLRYWLDNARHAQVASRSVRPLFDRLDNPGAVLDWLAKRPAIPGCAWAVGGWAACNVHEVIMVTGAVRVAIHATGPIDQMLRAWDLTPCDERDAAFSISACGSQFGRPIMGGAVTVSGLRVVDLWQAALDVVSDPGRGSDQAWAIAQRLIDRAEARSEDGRHD